MLRTRPPFEVAALSPTYTQPRAGDINERGPKCFRQQELGSCKHAVALVRLVSFLSTVALL